MVTKSDIIYQAGTEPGPEEAVLRAIVTKYLKEKLKAENIKFMETKIWKYFTSWKPEELTAGRHWQVKIQINFYL